MLFGSKDEFAVECYHEPRYPNDHGWVFGRMCAWCRGVDLGDLSETDCMLNVTEGFIQNYLGRLGDLRDPVIDDLPDELAFRQLDAALFEDDDRTDEEVHGDAARFTRFLFLTDWGESFDRFKAYLHDTGNGFRVVYQLRSGYAGSGRVTCAQLERPLLGFLEWMAVEKRLVPRIEPRTAFDHGLGRDPE